MVLLDLLGRRWALGVIWVLSDGPLTFSELQRALENVSTSVLSDRLRELRESRVVSTDPGGRYILTPEGDKLFQVVLPLADWAKRWARKS